ncbi:transglutaminaseTgpA domain-containing protein [Rathayibacter caricis]|uniref:transglutaminaseTgpA domain-containing protein n=1 Tax=Rathayibacter caricis TaxID=110936 RepID=UPI001FB399D6|nr:transglutaminaseTgpA domain-containing protein [Rathayibacter caricis]MCJ1696306.1 transglutaminaseTgpA domain-containing protein [Rathayibacter caricis]
MTARRGVDVAVDLLALAVLLGVGVIGFGRVFQGVDHLVAGALGVVGGLLIGWIGLRFRLGLLAMTGLVLAAYLLLGTAAAFRASSLLGVVPTLESLTGLLRGLVTSWKSLLTVEPPADGFPELLVVPFFAALVCAVVASTLALRSRRPLTALVPVGVLLVASILFGTAEAVAPLGQALAAGVVGVAWAAWRRRSVGTVPSADREPVDGSAARHLRVRRVASASAVLALAAATVVGVGAAVPAEGVRTTLRERIVPPFDLNDYATPLASFRRMVRDQKDATLFTVSGLPEGARVRLATMDAFDGTVYSVTGGGGGSGTFLRVGETLADDHAGSSATLRFVIGELSGVWLPDAGHATSVRFSGARADELQESLHYNDETGAAVVTARLAAGDAYTVTATIPDTPSAEELADAVAAPVVLPTPIGAPEAVQDAAIAAVGEATGAFEQAAALATTLSTTGFFSHGLEGETPSPPGHGAQRLGALLEDPERMVGDDEQYATGMALMASELGLPARVVMGFYPAAGTDLSGDVAVTGDDVHAWVEVALAGHGWIAVDPSPPEERILQDQSPKPAAQPQAQVLQPPPPPQEPAVVPPDVVQEDDVEDDGSLDLGWLLTALGVAGTALGVAAVVLGPALLVAALKRRKRRARLGAERPADRISGGWDEVVDRAADLGTVLPTGATRREDAAVLEAEYPAAPVATLARHADASVFGPAEPTDAQIAEFWAQTDDLVAQLHGSVTPLARLRARISLRSLLPARASATARSASRTTTTRRPAGNEDSDD